MGYAEQNLLTGEQIKARAQVHWWAWGKGAVLVVLAFLAAMGNAAGLSGLLALIGIYLVIRGLIIVITTELVVTDRRILAKFGLIRRSSIELLHTKVEGMSVDQSIFGRLLGFGTLVVNGTGTSKTPIPHVAKPLEFRRAALELIESKAA